MVESPTGAPLVGAEVTWTALSAEVSPTSHPDGPLVRAAIDDLTLSVTTDDTGLAEFPLDMSHGAGRSVLWATLSGHRAGFEFLHGWPATPAPVRIVLTPALSVPVRVVDASGAEVPGALVVHSGVSRPMGKELAASAADGATAEERELAGLVFERRALTGADGGTIALAQPSWSELWAEKGAQRSPSAPLDDRAEIVLALSETFRVRGLVHWPLGVVAPGPAIVLARDVSGGSPRPAGSAPIAADGSFGPLSIALGSASEFIFRLEAAGVMPLELSHAAPAPGELVELDFRPELGHAFDVEIVERLAEGAPAPVARARVGAAWQVDGRWIWSLAETREDGRARVAGCPAGTVFIRAEKQGYITRNVPETQLPLPEGRVLEFEFERGGLLRGRVTSAGEPVEDFEVYTWTDAPRLRDIARFFGRTDGRFEIEGVRLGELHIMAASAALPESALQRVRVEAGASPEVLLELPEPWLGMGRIVDALTLEPIPGAWIELIATHAHHHIQMRGGRRLARDDGSFEERHFAPHRARISAGAPGYGDVLAHGIARQPGELDFGVIALGRQQSWSVLLEADDGIDPSRFQFQADGFESLPYHRFPPDGRLELLDVPAGEYTAWVFPPDGTSQSSRLRLSPGREWILPWSVEAVEPLEVELHSPAGEPLPEGLRVYVAWHDRHGLLRTHTAPVGADARARISHVAAERFTVRVEQEGNDMLTWRDVALEPGAPRFVRVPLPGGSFRLRVVDAQGRPVAGAIVTYGRSDARRGDWHTFDTSDLEGRAVLHGVGFSPLYVAAQHPELGISSSQAFVLDAAGEGEGELVLDARRRIAGVLVDGDDPVPGVLVHLGALHGVRNLLITQSDMDGRFEFPRVAPGDYLLRLQGPGLWPALEPLRCGGGSEVHEIEVRRVGDLALRLLTAEGAPVVGARIALRPLELAGSLGDWVQRGDVASSCASLLTDAEGRLELRGLPRGRYECALPDADTPPVSIEVRAGLRVERELRLP